MSQKYSCGQKWRASFSPSHPFFSVSGSGMTVSLIQSFNLYSSIFYKNNRCVTSFPVEYMHHTFSKHLDDCKVTQLICTWHRPTNTTKSTIQPITVNETRNLIYTKLSFQISSLYKMSFSVVWDWPNITQQSIACAEFHQQKWLVSKQGIIFSPMNWHRTLQTHQQNTTLFQM